MSAADTLRKCVALLKQVDFADCAESTDLWHQHGMVLQEAGAVLRDGEKQEPVAYLRFRAAQSWSGNGNHDVESNEWLEVCNAYDIGDDKQPAFQVYTNPAPSLQAVGAVPEELLKNPQLLRIVQRMDEANRADDFGKRAREAFEELCEWIASYTAPQSAAALYQPPSAMDEKRIIEIAKRMPMKPWGTGSRIRDAIAFAWEVLKAATQQPAAPSGKWTDDDRREQEYFDRHPHIDPAPSGDVERETLIEALKDCARHPRKKQRDNIVKKALAAITATKEGGA